MTKRCYLVDSTNFVYGPYDSEDIAETVAEYGEYVAWLKGKDIDQYGYLIN